jgi:UDP-N-acetylmuramate dehydrogenase
MPHCLAEQVPLAPLTTLKVGGVARYVATITSLTELEEAIHFAEREGLPVFILGGGSNVLVPDAGFSGLVLLIALKGVQYDTTTDKVLVTCGAGESFDDLVAKTVAKGYWGLENLSHIPGTVGATPVQNVGAYGVEIADVIEAVVVYDYATHTTMSLTPAACAFGYRDSIFKQPAGHTWIVVAVVFRLSQQAQPKLTYADLQVLTTVSTITPTLVRETVIKIRASKFPDWHVVGTAGSFFKNPIISIGEATRLQTEYPLLPVYGVDTDHVKVPLGYILDKVCQLKGVRIGNVGLYEAQALVLVAYAPVTATEIDTFADMVAQKVYQLTGIKIEREVQTLCS